MKDQSVDQLCPGCERPLKDTAKPHCMEKRRTPCGWIACTKCQTIIDGRGNHYPRKPQETTP